MYTPDGKWFAEGHGVDPYFKVVEDPADLTKGVYQQLDKRIEVVMRLLKEHPPVAPKQPPYQKR